MSVKSFESGEIFGEKDIPDQRFLTGIVISSEEKKNEMTANRFYWMLVDTLGGNVDVVADREQLRKLPIPGSIISGTFYLSGILLSHR